MGWPISVAEIHKMYDNDQFNDIPIDNTYILGYTYDSYDIGT